MPRSITPRLPVLLLLATTAVAAFSGVATTVPVVEAFAVSRTAASARVRATTGIRLDPLRRRMAPRGASGDDDDEGDDRDRPPAAFLLGRDDDGVPSAPLDRPVLLAIDLTGLFVFAGVGKASHSAVDGSLDVAAVLTTAFPFFVSWCLLAPLVGCYTPDATRDARSAAVQTAKGWILAVPAGCVLRGILRGYVPPIPFVVVTLLSTLVLLTAGRVGYTVLSELYVEMF